MAKIGYVDLEILCLGMKNNWAFNEVDLEGSNIKRLGVGRILDALASLKDRKMIEMNSDGSFSVTELAKNYLWDKTLPSWLRVLRLLEIKAFSEEEISELVGIDKKTTSDNLEMLRANQLVMMSPQRKDDFLEKIYEILPEGIEKIKIVEINGYQNVSINNNNLKPNIEIMNMIELVIQDIDKLDIDQKIKNDLISKMTLLREKMQV